jgi:hypothetical protein
MATKDLAVRQSVQLSTEQLKFISGTEFVPPGLRGNVPAILACVATGRELGIGDMTAIRSIHVIDGKPTFSAELMTMLVRRAGHSIVGDIGPDAAAVTGTRADNGDTMTVRWTLEMADRAGLAGKQNWKKYPSAMLWARAVSQLCRELFADCFAGATYTTEELGEEHTDSAGEPTAVTADPGVDSATFPQASESQDEPTSPVEHDPWFPPVNLETGEIVAAGSDPVISDPQRKRLRAIQNKCGVTDDELRDLVWTISGVGSSKLIPVSTYEALVAAVEARGGGEFRIPESAQ